MRALLGRFAEARGGNVAMLTGLAAIPLVGAVALAVDYGRVTLVQRDMQSALDAAVLSAASAQVNRGGHISTLVESYFSKNYKAKVDSAAPAVSSSLDGQNVINATASVTIDTPLASILGYPSVQVNVTAAAAYGIGNAEIALVLDNTGSMFGAKLDGLKNAARALVDTIYAYPEASSRVKFGLVPFTYYVNVGMANRNMSWMNVAADYSTTVNACWDTYPNAVYSNPRTVNGTCYNDGTPSACSWVEYDVDWGTPVQQCGPVTSTYTWYGCAGSRNYPLNVQDTADGSNRVPGILNAMCSSPLLRLTATKQQVMDQIDAMTAVGETYIPSGLVWGWRVLSPNAPFADGAAASKDVRKFLVLMTDGANTRSPNYPDHEGSDVAVANQLTTELCNNIKAAGINVFTIGFDVTDPTLIAMLSGCASGRASAYTAANVSELQDAFAKIGRQMAAVRLAR